MNVTGARNVCCQSAIHHLERLRLAAHTLFPCAASSELWQGYQGMSLIGQILDCRPKMNGTGKASGGEAGRVPPAAPKR